MDARSDALPPTHRKKMTSAPPAIRVDLAAQELELHARGKILARYPVSTAANGPGERMNSFCTPRGRHCIRAKIGAGAPLGAVFVGRRATGEIYQRGLAAQSPRRDWILTRILWLRGCEPGFNRGGLVDSMRRYIYIHGAPDETPMGVPGSRGCIRMTNTAVAELFDRVPLGAAVEIHA